MTIIPTIVCSLNFGTWRKRQTRVPQEHVGYSRAGSTPAVPTKPKLPQEWPLHYPEKSHGMRELPVLHP